jgi:glucosamine kinase
MTDQGFVAVGVDAGGSSSIAVVSQDGKVLREAQGGGANPTTLGVDGAADVMIGTIRKALDRLRPNAIVIGAAGAGRGSVARTLEVLVRSAFPAARVLVGDDAKIAFRAAIPQGPGIVLIAGTGSIAYAEHGEKAAIVGGLGYLAGDEGSAFAIGMAAVRLYGRVLDQRARRDETADLVARTLNADDRDAYLAALYDAPLVPAKIAALAPPIIAFAGKGNRAATKIVQEAAKELGDLVKAAATQVDLVNASPRVALRGGLLRENSLLTYLLETRFFGDLPGVEIVRDGDAPVYGALRLAQSLGA